MQQVQRATLDTNKYTEPYINGYGSETEDYIKMGTSVLKNGGFYVSRYEGGTETARKAKTDLTNILVSKADVYPYVYVSWGKAINDTGEQYEGSKGAVELCKEMYILKQVYEVNSSLVYGVQWDSIMEWIENEENVSNSPTLGNYKSTTYTIPKETEYFVLNSATNTGEWKISTSNIEKATSNTYLLKTGKYAEINTKGDTNNSNGVQKNIYHLARNCREWTMEAIVMKMV